MKKMELPTLANMLGKAILITGGNFNDLRTNKVMHLCLETFEVTEAKSM